MNTLYLGYRYHSFNILYGKKSRCSFWDSYGTQETYYVLTLILLTWRIWWAPNNASKWQMVFISAFKGLSRSKAFVGLLSLLGKCRDSNKNWATALSSMFFSKSLCPDRPTVRLCTFQATYNVLKYRINKINIRLRHYATTLYVVSAT